MSSGSSTSYSSSLAQYLLEQFDSWSKNRQKLLEPRMRQAYAAYRRRYDMDEARRFLPGQRAKRWHSDSYPGWLKAKVLAGASVVKDMLSRGGRMAFMLEPESLERAVDQGVARAAAEGHTALIHDQTGRTDTVGRLCLAIDDAALYGHCWIDLGYEDVERPRFTTLDPMSGTASIELVTEPMRAIDRVSPWEMYWDLEALRSPDRLGAGVYRARNRSASQIANYNGALGFIETELRNVLAAAAVGQPGGSSKQPTKTEGERPGDSEFDRRSGDIHELIYFGEVPAHIVEAFEATLSGDTPAAPAPDVPSDAIARCATIECHVVIANQRVIRFVRTKKSERRYRMCYWEDVPDIPGGVGVADNAMDAQNNIVGLVRMLVNNIKQTGNVMWAGKRSDLVTDPRKIETGMFIEVGKDTLRIEDAFKQIKVDDVSAGVERALQFVMSLGDIETMIPRTEQGQDADYKMTAFENASRLERAARYFTGILQRFDTLVSTIIEWYYAGNLLDPNVDPKLKAPFRIKALGFASFFNRISRLNHLFTLLNLVLSKPEIAQLARIRWIVEEICKALDMDPSQVLKSVEEIESDAAELKAEVERQRAAGNADPRAIALAEAQIARLNAEAQNMRARTVALESKTRIEKARAVVDLTRAAPAMAAAPVPPSLPMPPEMAVAMTPAVQ